MNDIQWERILNKNPVGVTESEESNILNQLKRRVTFIKYKSNGHTYSRIYFLTLCEDAINYQGSRHRSKVEACKIKDIDQIREGFTTTVWTTCLKQRKITKDRESLAFSILYHNNRHSLDLLAETVDIRSDWITGLKYLVERYRSHMRTHHEITNQWIWRLFLQADRDRSGHLSRSEVRQLLQSLHIQLDERTIDKYFNQSNIRRENYDQLKHLDKDEFFIFYKLISCRPELLTIICQYNRSSALETRKLLADYNTIGKLPHKSLKEDSKETSLISFSSEKHKTSSSCTWGRNSQSAKQQHRPASPDISNRNNYLTVEQLKDFLQNEQHMKTVSIEDCSKLIIRFEPSSEGQESEELGVDGLRLLLLHDEFCIMNPNKTHQVYHDMTRPISDYFIATSHNTYIRDNQVYGDCTPETYIHALRTGCRAVELDCHDGDNMEPIVYHGHTLTTPITFRDIIKAIETEAFQVSPYPLFLNIENDCTYEQQGVMAHVLRNTFKNNLLSKPLSDKFEELPSPEDLKYKVIIRSRRYPKGKISDDPKSDHDVDENELKSKELHPEFASLIIYSEIVSFKNVTETIFTQQCFHSMSLKESKADDLIDAHPPDHLGLIRLTQHHIVRVYPGTKRQDSSNIKPIDYWQYGVQMAALNYQYNDESMWLQNGFFSDNGGCGYLLKPSFLLSKEILFNPKEKFYTKIKNLQIRIISGQHLVKEKESHIDKDIADPYVEVLTYGIKRDSTKHRTRSIRNNGLNPIWDYKIHIDVHCPELCLILFHVRDKDRYGPSTFIGQACIPFTSLQVGYRHIKLKAKNGDYICGTLFVHIEIEDM